ncbi:MAG: DEAD/DEAH box helicase family protein [Acidobacteria bacterium]|nr:DEAD/DEAH box helicase family protein [Acidobacteriota bacterium]
MPIDFKTFGASKAEPPPSDPIEIFRRLPKSENLIDLHVSQAEVLEEWNKKRGAKDTVIKLHTGGGKTLVGLLIGTSIMRHSGEPVVYLCPNRQLVDQTIALANSYGLDVCAYVKGKPLPGPFFDGKSLLVCTYHAVFHGASKFGTPGRPIVTLGGVICDDAHSAFSILRDQFTLSIDRSSRAYERLISLFASSFSEVGMVGTFEGIAQRAERSIIEVPYWSWFTKLEEVRNILGTTGDISESLEWQFLRDNLQYCHALFSGNAISITSVLPFVDLIPSFDKCRNRVFMSATFPDDGSSILAFDIDRTAAETAITSSSLAGISERMILIPAVTGAGEKSHTWVRSALKAIAGKVATCILTPSGTQADSWCPPASHPVSAEGVQDAVKFLTDGSDKGPYAFAQRYEGIDLSGNACRILIIDGTPTAMSAYDTYRAVVLNGSRSIDLWVAQKIEQGAGRASRGPSDYSVVLLVGDSLVHWISRQRNLQLMTSATRAQIEIGQEVSRHIESYKDFGDVMNKCLGRDRDWRRFAAEQLADRMKSTEAEESDLSDASTERKALRIWRDGFHEKAITTIVRHLEKKSLDDATRGWFFQLAARIASHWGATEKSEEFQKSAYLSNRLLLKPRAPLPYAPITIVDDQIEKVFGRLKSFAFRRAVLQEFDDAMQPLVNAASSNQMDAAMEKLADFIGLKAQRPDNTSTNGKGPDLLWFLSNLDAWVIESKSKKLAQNALTKEEHGQLLVAGVWFDSMYPKHQKLLVSMIPSGKCTDSSQAVGVLSLDTTALSNLVTAVRAAYDEISHAVLEGEQLKQRIAQVWEKYKLTAEKLSTHLKPLQKN